MSKLIRISDEACSKLDHMAHNTGLSRQDIINKANEAYAAIKNNPKQWQAEQEELALWDSTLEDGLTDL